MSGDPLSLIDAWNGLMVAHGLQRWEPSARTTAEARAYLAWCHLRQVDPYRFMRARFDAIDYRHRLRLAQLASDTFLVKFRAWGDVKQSAAVAQERAGSNVVDDTVRDGSKLIVLWEHAKARYAAAGAADLCRVSARTFTGGWQAASKWCAACPVAEECARDRSR